MKKSNIQTVKVTVTKAGTDVLKVTYYSGRTRSMTISTMTKSVSEFITGNCNTIVREMDDRITTTFYASENALDNAIEVMKEQIVRRCMNTITTTKYTFNGKRFTINANDFKIQCGKLLYCTGYNKAITINHVIDWHYDNAIRIRNIIIENFKG